LKFPNVYWRPSVAYFDGIYLQVKNFTELTLPREVFIGKHVFSINDIPLNSCTIYIAGLMIPDTLHVLIPLWELYKYARRKELKMYEVCYKEEISMCFVLITLGTLIGRLI